MCKAMCSKIWIFYLFVTGAFIKGCHGNNVTLTSQSLDQWENTDVTLTCSYFGDYGSVGYFQWTLKTSSEEMNSSVGYDCIPSRPWLSNSMVYSYRCINRTEHTVTLKSITQQRHGETWKCEFLLGEFSFKSNILQILVKVPVKNTSINPHANGIYTTKENASVSWICKTSECRPEPKFLWYKQASTQSGESETIIAETGPKNGIVDTLQSYNSTYGLSLNRTWNGWKLFCGATNRNGSIVLSTKILINVTYPPDEPPRIGLYQNGIVIFVIKNTSLDLVCSITGGNPLPRLEWNQSGSLSQTLSNTTVTKTLKWQASDNNRHDLICQSIQEHKNETAYVTIEVLYPPETPVIAVKTSSGSYVNVNTTLDVIEGTTYTVNCTAKSNPQVSLFKWNNLPPSSSPILYVDKADRGHTVTVTCNVSNVMQISDTMPAVTGMNITQLKVNVLFPPKVDILRDVTIIEGEEKDCTCNFTQGNPGVTNITWSWKGSLWDGPHLQLKNVSRNQAGEYRCSVQNIMAASDGRRELGNSNMTFNLTVQYKAQILKFTVNDDEKNQVTLSENDTVNISCEIEGDPFPTGELLHHRDCCNLHELHQTFTASQLSSNLRLSSVFRALCTDTGVQTCIGSNKFYNGLHSTSNKSISLFVNCSPRKSFSFEVTENVTSALNDTATFHFTAMAYPPPSFQWYQIVNGVSKSEAIGSIIENSSISTNVMHIKFTLEHVEESHYGEYLLNVTNQFGTFQQTFHLVPEGKPNPPTYYDFYPDSVTSDSATIWWEPGFDGGFPQSFIISYNLTASKWYNESAISHNKERRMNKTITELASVSVYHVLIYAQNEKGAVRVPHAIIVNTKEPVSEELKNPINIGAAAGGAVAGILAIVVVVVAAVFIVRKRSLGKQEPAQGEKYDLKDSHTYTNVSKEFHTQKLKESDTAFVLETKQASLDSPKLPERMPTKVAATHHLQELDDYDDKADERIYGNTYEMIKRIERINVSELLPYLTNKPTDFFGSEFTKLPAGLLKPYEFSQKTENIALNRYHGIYPYDHSRVKIADEPSFFINACYIDGYKKKKAFIASLGPLSKTTYNFVTFWKMVWSEKSDVIVMLTKLTEPSGVKCDPYWPKPESTQVYGDVTATNVGEDAYSDYVLRNFTLSKGNERRKLMQFHFMAWPDKSIPEDVTCLLEFKKRVNANHSSGPIIVHCSAGIGRTGTLIALEILIEEGRRKGSVNVVECVKTMRGQRTSMVQTVDQYHYIYKALVNALVFDCEAVTPQKFQKYVDKTNTDQFNKMFQTLNQTVEADSTLESNTRTANKMQRDKNRMGSDIPGDSHRVRLFLNRDEETSLDYINAVYIDSFTKKEHFIVAQSPMTNGVEDFLCMIYQVECSCIVSLGDTQQGRNVGMYIPADNTKSLSIGSFNVTCKVLDTKDNYVIRKFKVEFKGKYEGGEKKVYHFEYTDWALGQKTPSDPHSFVQFAKEVEDFASQLGTGKSQVLVHCLNAYERSCLFCAVVTLVEKVKYEGEVCVSNTLRHIRARRRLAIPNMEQFQFCFRAVCAYINMDTTGSSIEEKAYINMALA